MQKEDWAPTYTLKQIREDYLIDTMFIRFIMNLGTESGKKIRAEQERHNPMDKFAVRL